MATELPDYELNGRLFFPLNGREVAAVVQDNPNLENWNGLDMRGLTPADMNITVSEITDANTGEVIECTDEIRSLIAAMMHDNMSKTLQFED